MNGAGTGGHTVTIQKQKVEATQPVPRRTLPALAAVVVGAKVRTAVQFLSVTTTSRTTVTATLVSVLCDKQTSVC